MHKGLLKSWFDNKGFGFIESPELNQVTFIHISTLKKMSRKPRIGDVIYFEIEQQTNGKTRAINCRIDGVSTKSLKPKKHLAYKKVPEPGNRAVLILTILGICVFAYYRLGPNSQHTPTSQFKTPTNQALPAQTVPKSKSKFEPNYTCDGRKHCRQMSSYQEAKFFIKNCPNTAMDGDNDGIPCENESRFK